jgi:hypothetical protein
MAWRATVPTARRSLGASFASSATVVTAATHMPGRGSGGDGGAPRGGAAAGGGALLRAAAPSAAAAAALAALAPPHALLAAVAPAPGGGGSDAPDDDGGSSGGAQAAAEAARPPPTMRELLGMLEAAHAYALAFAEARPDVANVPKLARRIAQNARHAGEQVAAAAAAGAAASAAEAGPPVGGGGGAAERVQGILNNVRGFAAELQAMAEAPGVVAVQRKFRMPRPPGALAGGGGGGGGGASSSGGNGDDSGGGAPDMLEVEVDVVAHGGQTWIEVKGGQVGGGVGVPSKEGCRARRMPAGSVQAQKGGATAPLPAPTITPDPLHPTPPPPRCSASAATGGSASRACARRWRRSWRSRPRRAARCASGRRRWWCTAPTAWTPRWPRR